MAHQRRLCRPRGPAACRWLLCPFAPLGRAGAVCSGLARMGRTVGHFAVIILGLRPQKISIKIILDYNLCRNARIYRPLHQSQIIILQSGVARPIIFPSGESIKSILITPAHHAVVPRGLRSRVAAAGTGNMLPPSPPGNKKAQFCRKIAPIIPQESLLSAQNTASIGRSGIFNSKITPRKGQKKL